jgi:hypothetical protein
LDIDEEDALMCTWNIEYDVKQPFSHLFN